MLDILCHIYSIVEASVIPHMAASCILWHTAYACYISHRIVTLHSLTSDDILTDFVTSYKCPIRIYERDLSQFSITVRSTIVEIISNSRSYNHDLSLLTNLKSVQIINSSKSYPHIKEMIVHDCTVAANNPHVQTLKIRGHKIIPSLHYLTNLSSLTIQSVMVDVNWHIGAMTHLTKLSLCRDLAMACHIPTSLHKLKLDCSKNHCVVAAINAICELRDLTIRNYNNTDAYLNIFKGCANVIGQLTSLELDVRSISDVDIMAASHLTSLKINNRLHDTDIGSCTGSCLKNMSLLRRLYICHQRVNCMYFGIHITSVTILRAIVEHFDRICELHNLKILVLAYSTIIDYDPCVLKSLHKLQYLDIGLSNIKFKEASEIPLSITKIGISGNDIHLANMLHDRIIELVVRNLIHIPVPDDMLRHISSRYKIIRFKNCVITHSMKIISCDKIIFDICITEDHKMLYDDIILPILNDIYDNHIPFKTVLIGQYYWL